MKKAFACLSLLSCGLFIYACSSGGSSSAPTPPASKPDSYEKTIAVAAKKADYYIRLAFDLADGYLSRENVANTNIAPSRRYGDDTKYANSLNFTDARTEGSGKITSNHLGGFEFWYLRADDENDQSSFSTPIADYEGIDGETTTNLFKRDKIVSRANAAGWGGAKRYELSFWQEGISFDIEYFAPGAYTSKTTKIRTASFNNFTVEDSSDTNKPFTVTVTNLTGQILPPVSHGHMPSAKDLFVIQDGNIIITGTDPDDGATTYTINLTYSNDVATGRFTGTFDGKTFGADFTAKRTESYYIIDGDTSLKKHYIFWDYPL